MNSIESNFIVLKIRFHLHHRTVHNIPKRYWQLTID